MNQRPYASEVFGTVAMALLPWPLVWAGLYGLHNVWATFALYHGMCITAYAWARRPLAAHPNPVWRSAHWARLGAVCVVATAATYFAAGILGRLTDTHRIELRLLHLGIRGTASEIALFVWFAAVNPVAEELFWRVTIYGRLRAANLQPGPAAVLAGTLFGAWHALPVALLLGPLVVGPAVVGLSATGWLLALFYERVRSAAPPILLHALGADLPVLVLVWLDVLARH